MAGASTTRSSSGWWGSTGWPSMATTTGRWPWNRRPKIRALAALMRRSRIRSPHCTGISSNTRPLMVTVLPTRPL